MISQGLIDSLVPLLACIFFVGGIAVSILACSRFMLNPVSHNLPQTKPTSRFYVADFFSLSFMMAPSLSISQHYAREVGASGGGITFVMAMVFILVVVVWWNAVNTLSRLGIADAKRRLVFKCFVMPVAYGITVAGIPATILMWSVRILEHVDRPGLTLCVGCSVGIVILAVAVRFLAKWVILEAKYGPSAADKPKTQETAASPS